MKAIQLCFLTAVLALATGCFARMQRPDPLTGWHFAGLTKLRSNKAITDDHQDYIQNLPPEEKKYVGSIQFFEDRRGQHAVEIPIDLHGTWWKHVLIYDENNNRAKVIKYKSGRYRS